MNKDLQNKLKEIYPNLNVSIDCEDGWYMILETLLENIFNYTDVEINVVQIKQKFGGLRVYVRFPEDTSEYTKGQLLGLTQMSESISHKTCEY
jgi:hypothetical protein